MLLDTVPANAGPNDEMAAAVVQLVVRTIANCAMHSAAHAPLLALGAPDVLRPLLTHPSKAARFHAARCLVFLGDYGVTPVNIFDGSIDGTDELLAADDVVWIPPEQADGTSIWTRMRGASVEKMVRYGRWVPLWEARASALVMGCGWDVPALVGCYCCGTNLLCCCLFSYHRTPVACAGH